MKVIPQRHDWDCGVASLAMLLDIPYGDAAQIVRDVIDDPLLKKRGLILRQLEEIFDHLGQPTKRVYRSNQYLEGRTGILGLNGGDCDPCGHWVVLKDGMIIDPSGGEVHKPDEYMTKFGCRPATLLITV